MFFIVIIILVIIFIAFSQNNGKKNVANTGMNTNISIYDKYVTKEYLMTKTELKFFRELKKITDKLELLIFPQVNMEKIIQVSDNNVSDRNKIKSRSIDYTIVKSNNCKIVCCIELDDYTHNRQSVIKKDEIRNQIFKKANIPLHRVKVSNYYNLEELENTIRNEMNK